MKQIQTGGIIYKEYTGGGGITELQSFWDSVREHSPTRLLRDIHTPHKAGLWPGSSGSFYNPAKAAVVSLIGYYAPEKPDWPFREIASLTNLVAGRIMVTPSGRVYQIFGRTGRADAFDELNSPEKVTQDYVTAVKELPNDERTNLYFLEQRSAYRDNHKGLVVAQRGIDMLVTILLSKNLEDALEHLGLYHPRDLGREFPFLKDLSENDSFLETFFGN